MQIKKYWAVWQAVWQILLAAKIKQSTLIFRITVIVFLMLRLREIRGERSVNRGGTVLYASTRVVASTTTHYDIDASRLDSPFVAQNSTGGDISLAQLELEGELAQTEAASVPAAIDEVEQGSLTSRFLSYRGLLRTLNGRLRRSAINGRNSERNLQS